MGNTDFFCTTGFSNNGKRELILWDKRNNSMYNYFINFK